jgi:hypothetical protein
MSISLNDLFSQALASQATGASSAVGRASSNTKLGADFGKLLELQMNQSVLGGLSGLGASDESSASGGDSAYSSLMGLSSSNSNSSMESMMMLQLLETLVNRLSALEQKMTPAAAAAATPAASDAVTVADPTGVAPAAASETP